MLLYACTIFISAFVLFLVQPIMAKQILPWFGGSAAVWTTCMVFFQVVLLVGYAYSDASIRWLKPRAQAFVHIGLLAVSLAVLPIVPGSAWKPAGDEDPTGLILGLLVATIGLPYFLLSTTGPLIQAWFARSFPAGTVYRLFALSNFASLLALIGYPFLVEPWISTRLQSWIWSAAYAVFVVLCSAAALYSLKGGAATGSAFATAGAGAVLPRESTSAPPGWGDLMLWLLLSALGSGLLLAVSNHITQNIASVPFLWLLPLTLYLLTFILCFEGRGWYSRKTFLGPLAVMLMAMAWGLYANGAVLEVTLEIPLYSAGLFICCMFLHGELSRMRPEPRYLTRFYLMISLGGAVGGLLVGMVAPRVFDGYWEIGIGLVATALAAVWVLRDLGRLGRMAALLVTLVCAKFVYDYVASGTEDMLHRSRNFYGVVSVRDSGPASDLESTRNLTHGQILHGRQYLNPARRAEPTTYYGPDSGVGLALQIRAEDGPSRVGVIGLGTGTLATWGRAGDLHRFYEIDPEVITVAKEQFSYLRDSKAKIETVLGDARLQLEREAPQRFDVLAVDAFSSDSIPVHLVTREALAIYMKHINERGIIAFHVTNRFLDLPPVVADLARQAGLHAVMVAHEPGERDAGALNRSVWMLLSRDATLADHPRLKERLQPVKSIPGLRTWTDDFSSLFQILK
jgi:hypothetical protein